MTVPPSLRRAGRILGWSLLGLVLVLFFALAGGMAFLRTQPGERWIADTAVSVLKHVGLEAQLGSLEGPLPFSLHLRDVRLADGQGVWLDVPAATLRIGAGALLLIVLLVVLLRGCASSTPESTPETPTATKTTPKKSSKKTETVDEDEDTDEATDESTDSDATKTTAKKEENEVTKVKVSVAKGKTAWIEVKVDGKSVYGAQATGPFEQEYTPESSIEITTSKPSDVTVTKNGEKVRYDTKTSGVARVTITVPKKETTGSENGESSDGTDATDGTDTTDGTDAQSTDGADTATDGQTPTDSTDYSYDSY